MAKGWTWWSEADARAEIALWKASGQSLLKFTRGRGYTEARLRWWRKQIGDVPPAAPMALVPVSVIDAKSSRHVVEVEAAVTDIGTPIEVVLRDGRIIRVQRGFDAETLMSVVRVLEGSC